MNRRNFLALTPAFPAAAKATLTLTDGQVSTDLDVSILKTQDGDRVILSCAGHISRDAADRIRAMWEQAMPGTKAIVLLDGMKVEGVLRGPE